MAASAVMKPSTSSNSDPARSSSAWSQPSLPELSNSASAADLPLDFGSTSMEDIMRNTHGDNVGVGEPMAGGETFAGTVKSEVSETPEELRSEINAPRNAESFGGVSSVDYGSTSRNLGEMDISARVNEIVEMDVGLDWGGFAADTSGTERFEHMVHQSPLAIGSPMVGFGSGMGFFASEGGLGRGAKRAPPILNLEDSAASRRQKRMIKNRESAARSREREKAYIAGLESRVNRLKQENAALQMEIEKEKEEQFNKLIRTEYHITSKKNLLRRLKKWSSTEW